MQRSLNDPLYRLAERCGLHLQYKALSGEVKDASPETLKALLRANGFAVDSVATVRDSLEVLEAQDADRKYPYEIIVESNRTHSLSFGEQSSWRLCCTESNAVVAEGYAKLAVELPAIQSGIYELTLSSGADAETVLVLASQKRAPMLNLHTEKERLWGVTAALYGLRSNRNMGVGDFQDLTTLGQQLGSSGAAYLGINPVHALGSYDHEVISPYSPSHRGMLNTGHIALDHIPGLAHSRTAKRIIANTRDGIASSSQTDFIDYALLKPVHLQALEALYVCFMEECDPATKKTFHEFSTMVGADATEFARYELLSGHFGGDWRLWTDEQTDSRIETTEQGVSVGLRDVEFHLWLQWVADYQLGVAQQQAQHSGMTLGLYLDLAVGSRLGGAESYCEKSSLAAGVSIGAPPDHLSPGGQNWQLAAYSPVKLRAQKYAAFRRILRASMKHAGVLRIDHILGLNRSYWIPDDGSPGGYISQPMESLLTVIKMEAERAQTVIIGEDLGLVPRGFRTTMREHGIYGYSVAQFEKTKTGQFKPPANYDAQIIACFGTHDTATLEGYRRGTDIVWWKKMDWIDQDAVQSLRRQRERDVHALMHIDDHTQSVNTSVVPLSAEAFRKTIYSALCGSPAAMVSAQLDDLLVNAEAQNLPGTIDEHPNWRRRYQCHVDEVAESKGMAELTDCVRTAGR